MLKKISIILMFCFYSTHAGAQIYKWVDEQGNIHYGDKPIVNSEEMDIDVKKKGNLKVSGTREENRQKLLNAYAEDQQRKNKEKEKLKKKKKKRQEHCMRSKDNLKTYERASSLYNLDKEGNRVTMSNDEREKATATLKKYLKKYCK